MHERAPTELGDEDVRGHRVVINALAARFGGTAYASVHLARELSLRPDIETVAVVTRVNSIVARGLANDRIVRCITLRDVTKLELLDRTWWEAVRLPSLIAREDADVLVSMSGMLPIRPRCRVICLLFNPVMFERQTFANALRRWAVRRTTRVASLVAAPTKLMARLVERATGRLCAVIPLGVDHAVFSPAESEGHDLLCVADFYAHKRHDLLLSAWNRLSQPRPRLRLVGNAKVEPMSYSRVLRQISTLDEPERVVIQHGLKLEQLVEAYRSARVFVLPSESESFSMPLAESMACGVPAVVRDLPSLQETGGAGARYVHGSDPDQWASALDNLMGDPDGYQDARAAAVRAGERFSWRAFASSLADAM